MKKAERKMNNKGFSLILVIICMTFISVLASMILAMAVNNVQMRVVEEEASDNFYSAEEVLDEVRANMEKQANMALGDAYNLFLQKYAATAPKNRESVFVTSLSSVLNDLVKKDFIDNFDAADAAKYEAFLAKYLGVAKNRSGIRIDKAEDVILVPGSESSKITVKGLTITYTGDDGYVTSIKTDLVVKITYPKFFEDNIAGPAFLDYTIITDNNVEKNGGQTVSTIRGCVYSGKDLVVSNGANLTVQSQYLIAKNAIDVGSNSTLSIAKGSLDQLKYASKKKTGLWTNSILTTTTNRTMASTNKLNISDMDCYVQDDLTINGIADAVTISGGNYYGYGSGLIDEASANSAINLNAKDIQLKLDGLNHLWLAGQSYISIPAGYGRDVLAGERDPIPVMQGESVAFKGNQAAYLMPGDSIEGVWHNPMTVAEYNAAKKLIDGRSGTSESDYSLVLSTRKADSINGDIMNLDQYLDISSDTTKGDYTSRYTPVHVQYKNGGTMVYQ